ncbi:MAG TPA: TPM domain-containing protein [Myxococcales bacterium]
MRRLTRRQLLERIDGERIRQAIEDVERRSTGEVRVSISTFFWGSVRRNAELAFTRLGMAATKERNAVLFFLVPSRRRLVVMGDTAIHEQVGGEFWGKLSDDMLQRMRAGEFTEGLVLGIERAGEVLARHFPRLVPGPNLLPDEIDLGPRHPPA